MSTKQSWGFAEGDEIAPGRYALERLGGGKRFEVYLASDDHIDSPVAAKVIRPDLVEDRTSLRVLAREASWLGRLSHPAIVRAYGGEMSGPRPHLVLEYVDGPTLTMLLKRYGRLEPQQLAPLAQTLCAALRFLSAEEVVHLDIKPSNVVMGERPRLIDFSVARGLDRAIALRKPVGTARYMAPEQRDPEAFGGVGLAADVWGFGATLHEAATGIRFDAQNKVEVPDDAGGAIAAVIRRCLVADASERPTPAEVAEMLGGI